MNQSTFSNYHAALGNGSLDNCSGGSYTGLWYNQHEPLASGCFVNGYYYLNDYHVFISSPLTKNKSTFSDYHWWDITSSNWHGPILRIGCDYAEVVHSGQFASMHSQISMNHPLTGSPSNSIIFT